MTVTTLDSGALIALDRQSKRMISICELVAAGKMDIAIPTGVLAQVLRNPTRQVRINRLLTLDGGVKIVPLDEDTARRIGRLCARSGATDVIDVSVVLCAQEHGGPVLTSDPDDIRAVDASLEIEAI
jgi:PIN domain nuclease of toxin-antitoxin system